MAAVARAHSVGIWLNLNERAALFEFFDDCLAAFKAVHAFKLTAVFVDMAVVGEHAQHRQSRALGNLKVVRVVRRSHFNRARAKGHVNVFVRHDGYRAADNGQYHVFADHVLVAFVFRVDRNAGIAEHRLGARRSDGDRTVSVFGVIAHVPEVALLILMLDLNIRERRFALGTPVDNAVAAVNQPLFIQLDEYVDNGA
ncbi:hypothetical protein SDC9_178100 [bioreactor metagenome]|uniref:Uncharacterized protein n=1 Tax=bioreactor metagenome TaxID=1076179 RepID=A0A645GY06_9ZZZZ